MFPFLCLPLDIYIPAVDDSCKRLGMRDRMMMKLSQPITTIAYTHMLIVYTSVKERVSLCYG